MKRVHVVVTQDDIDRGIRCKVALCPIALAASRASGRSVTFAGDKIYLPTRLYWLTGREKIGYVPGEARDFALNFDCNHAVSPIEFDAVFP